MMTMLYSIRITVTVEGSVDLQQDQSETINFPIHVRLALQCRRWVLWQAGDRSVARLPHAPFASEITRVTIARKHL